jgi:hypothetical protein
VTPPVAQRDLSGAQTTTLKPRPIAAAQTRAKHSVPLRDHASITDRRAFLQASGALLAGAALYLPGAAGAQGARGSFEQWRDAFRPRALARGVRIDRRVG